MGHIAEPKNHDVIIESPTLTEQERKEIGQYIEKLKRKRKNIKSTTEKRKTKRQA